ncbi:ABC transporter ATP-binding protein [Streptomyces viridochromogenes]|uniref:ABC transporter ATP-binding protein n=1 Tax=Streptomyces viridochromogenes TaxID=1938 RepID=UPI00069D50D0
MVDAAASGTAPLLAVRDLAVDFATDRGRVSAVRGVSFTLQAGQSLAILGESGSGKSVTGKALLGLIDPPGRVRGAIEFEGENIVGWDEARLNTVRGPGVSMVFQDSFDSLNPVYSVGSQVTELLRVRQGLDRRVARERAVALMRQVGIPAAEERLKDYPHQFSGGMRQRMCIALAIALRPRLLIADEPTTALDVTVQAGILRLVRQLQRETRMALIFVTHDLAVARLVASEVAVMYAGRIVERGGIDDIYRRPAHPYTQALLASQPDTARSWSDLRPIAGSPPDKAGIVPGCAFHPRCPIATDRCTTEEPDLRALSADRLSRCHHAEEVLDAAH